MVIQFCDQVRGIFWLGPLQLLLTKHLPRRGSPAQSTLPTPNWGVSGHGRVPVAQGRVERATQSSHIIPRADWLWKRPPESQVAPDTQLPLPPKVTP